MQVPADPADVAAVVSKTLRGPARRHLHLSRPAQPIGDLLGQTVAEVVFVRQIAFVREWQHGNRAARIGGAPTQRHQGRHCSHCSQRDG